MGIRVGSLVGLSGSFGKPSRTSALIQAVADRAARRYAVSGATHDLADFGASLGAARKLGDLDATALSIVESVLAADVLIVGTPTYKGSYTGLFKHLIDLLDPLSLQGKPVLLTATGGSDRHALVIEHQLRPLFGFFMAQTLPIGLYATDKAFTDYRLTDESILRRVDQAVADLARFLPPATRHLNVVAGG